MTIASGTRLGPYEIQQLLGSGGMGRVYRALDTRLERIVALKVLREDTLHSQANLRSRFEREAVAASRLSHPHICALYDVGRHEEVDFLVMEYLEGQTLSERLRQGGLRFRESLQIAIEVASALEEAHAAGIIHRDLKPSNIMLTRSGSKLLDFGVAKLRPVVPQAPDTATTTHTHHTVAGALVGTLAYMSPEQLEGRDADARSDIFALGVLMYEMLTNRRPFEGDSSGELLRSIEGREPRVPSALSHSCPPELDQAVGRCLARNPAERWQTARDLGLQLRWIARKAEDDASAPQRRQRIRRAFAWMAAVTSLLALGVWLRSVTGDPPSPWPRSASRQLTTMPGWEGEPAISPDGGLVAYVSDETGSFDVNIVDVQGGNTLRLTDSPSVDRAPEWLPDGSAILFASDRSGRPDVWKVPRLGGGATLLVNDADDPAISPDGMWIAFVRAGPSGDTRVFVAPLAEPTRARMVSLDGQGLWDHRQPGWSPDGRRIVYRAQRDLWVTATDGGATYRLTTDNEPDSAPTWSADGRHVYFSSFREGTIALWRVKAGGGVPERLTLGSGPEVHPRLSRDGRRLTYSTSKVASDIVVLARGPGRETKITGLREAESPSLEPQGRAVVFVSDRLGRFDLWVQRLSEGQLSGVPQRLTDHVGSVSKPAWSRDGRWIAYHRVEGGQRDIWLVPSEGGSPNRFTDDLAPDIHPAWSPDGSEIAFVSERGGGGSHVWTQAVSRGRPAGPPRRLTSGPVVDAAPVFSPDGRQVAFARAGDEGRGEVWVVPAHGGKDRRVGTFSGVQRVRWETPATLLVSGHWDPPHVEIRRVRVATGAQFSLDPTLLLGQNPGLVDFDISVDARLLAYAREERRGDIWVLEARGRPFE
jgi:eukaryotic-like serine/threonine-protein kinase